MAYVQGMTGESDLRPLLGEDGGSRSPPLVVPRKGLDRVDELLCFQPPIVTSHSPFMRARGAQAQRSLKVLRGNVDL